MVEVFKKTKNLEGYNPLEIIEADWEGQTTREQFDVLLVAFIFVNNYTTPE